MERQCCWESFQQKAKYEQKSKRHGYKGKKEQYLAPNADKQILLYWKIVCDHLENKSVEIE